MQNKQVLVYGGTGAQGSAITQALISNGHIVKAQTRSTSNAKKIIAMGAVPVYADYENLKALDDATKDCSAVVLTLPLAFDIDAAMHWADNIIKAAQSAAVKLLCFQC